MKQTPHSRIAYLEQRLIRAERERDEARKVMSDHLHTARLAALVEALTEENRVLRLANRSLAGVTK